MDNTKRNSSTCYPVMNSANSVDVELTKAAIEKLPDLYDLAKTGIGECRQVYEKTAQVIEETYKTAIAASQKRIKMYLKQLENSILSSEERVRVFDMIDKESEYIKELEKIKSQQLQEVQDKYDALVNKTVLTVGGITVGLASPFLIYGALKIYQACKTR